MGTKNNPGKFDCYANALPDEPMFILLSRDPTFYKYVFNWAEERIQQIKCGERPDNDFAMVQEAIDCAKAGQNWRKDNYGIWRRK